MTPFDAAILGVVEGISEFLPISSTGHLILASSLLGLPQGALEKTFEIAIQLGAIFAVVALYWKRFFDIELLTKLFVAFLPTAIIGFTVYPFFKAVLNGNAHIVVWSLIIGGIVLIAFDYWRMRLKSPSASLRGPASSSPYVLVRLLARLPRASHLELFKRILSREDGTIESLTYAQCAILGVCQSVAIIPGVSRSAATIVGGEMLGMSRAAVVEFSFLLAVPTMLAATAFDVLKQRHAFSAADAGLIGIGGLVAFVVALASIRWLLHFVKNHGFAAFGVYRIVVGLAFLLLVTGF